MSIRKFPQIVSHLLFHLQFITIPFSASRNPSEKCHCVLGKGTLDMDHGEPSSLDALLGGL